MKNTAAKAIAAFMFLLTVLPACIGFAQTKEATPPKEMSLWQAHRTIAFAMKWGYLSFSTKFGTVQSGVLNADSLQFTSNEITVTFKDEKGNSFHLKRNVLDSDKRSGFADKRSVFICTDEDHKGYKNFNVGFYHLDDTHPACAKSSGYERAICLNAREWYMPAFDELYKRATSTPASTADFHQQATTWRSLATKPAISEGARVQRLLAEEAIGQKQLDEALNHYELGVESDPTWATGWHNAALLAGELGYYADAAHHMQNYLELVPDSEDAQAARDSIDIWKYKAGH